MTTPAPKPRVIKFRAWNGEEMVSPDYITRDGVAFWKENSIPTCSGDVMQSTGLHDSEGAEIYEGDIIKFTYWWFDGNPAESELTGEVVYIPESLSFGLRGVKNKEWIKHIGGNDGDSDTAPFAFWRFSEDDFRVIGNIHQNPESLQ